MILKHYFIYDPANGRIRRTGRSEEQYLPAIGAAAFPLLLGVSEEAVDWRRNKVVDGEVVPMTEAELQAIAAAQAAKQASRPIDIRPRHFLLLLKAVKQAGVPLPQELLDLLAEAASRNQ